MTNESCIENFFTSSPISLWEFQIRSTLDCFVPMFDEADKIKSSKIALETQFGLSAKRRPLYESLTCESITLKYDVRLESSNFDLTSNFLDVSTLLIECNGELSSRSIALVPIHL